MTLLAWLQLVLIFFFFFNSYIKRGCNWIVHDVAYKTLVDSFSYNNDDVLSD